MSRQFDVHRSPARNRLILFLVNVQSNRFVHSERCVVVPLVETGSFDVAESDVSPRFIVETVRVTLDPLQITNVPRRVLGPAIVTLDDNSDRITFALDALLSRAWR